MESKEKKKDNLQEDYSWELLQEYMNLFDRGHVFSDIKDMYA